MSDPVGVGGGRFPPGQERAKLVAELGNYLAAWEQRLRAPAAAADMGGVREWSAELQVKARAVGFGGVAHHLSRCEALIGASGPLDVASLSAALKDLSELAWQAKQELPPAERAQVDRILEEGRQGPGGPPSSLAPPPMLTVHPGLRRGAAGPSQNPPMGPLPGAPSPRAEPSGMGSVEPPRIVSPIPPPPPGVRAPPVGPNSGFGTSRPAPAAPKGGFESPAPLPAVPPATPERAPAENQPPSDRARPNLAVRTMFRLRAFGQAAAPRAPDPPLPPAGGGTPPPGGASPLLGLRGFSHPPPAPGAGLPGSGGSGLPGPSGSGLPAAGRPLPALGGGPGALPPLGGGGHPGMGSGSGAADPGGPALPGLGGRASGTPGSPKQAMPRYLSNSLPPLPEGGEARVPTPGDSRLSDLIGGRGGAKRESASRARRDSKGVKAVRRREAPGSGFPWWLGVLAALCAGVVTLVGVLSWNRLRTPTDQQRPAGSAASSASSPSVAAASGAGPVVTAPAIPRARTPEGEALEDLRVKAHGKGTKDSPELNAWVDHQAALQAKLLQTGKCEGSTAACAILYRPGEDTGSGRITPRKPSSPKSVRSRWMAGLRMPSIPVEDDLRVQRIFERLTDTPTGREQVAQILFRCGAYKDLIQATLIRYDLPPSLLAVVFAESGCSPTIKSPVGAEGLWQFMPESGRAYHLHITDGVLDERHSPQKSTEAAVHFLADLYAKFGSWDLAFAAYNMGPYGLYARQQRAGGGDVGFWDLLDADLLPGETSNYVPIIEAYALILENLQKLKFASVQMRSPEVTGDLDAPPGTRIGLIARAASTSVNQIRSLNLDLKADVIPTIPGQRFAVQVPHDSVWQARDQLDELIAQGSYDDQCVADNFDWGKQPFNKEMRDECRRRLGAPAGRPSH